MVITSYHDTKNASSLNSQHGESETTTGKKDYTANYQTDSTGQWVLHDYSGSAHYTDAWGGSTDDLVYRWSSASQGVCSEQDTQNGVVYQSTYTGGVDQNHDIITDPMDVDVYEDPFQTGWYNSVFITHCYADNVHWNWVKDSGTVMDVQVNARTAMKLLTGGKSGVNRKSLISITGSAVEYGRPYIDAPSGLTCDGAGLFYPWEGVQMNQVIRPGSRCWAGGRCLASIWTAAAMFTACCRTARH